MSRDWDHCSLFGAEKFNEKYVWEEDNIIQMTNQTVVIISAITQFFLWIFFNIKLINYMENSFSV